MVWRQVVVVFTTLRTRSLVSSTPLELRSSCSSEPHIFGSLSTCYVVCCLGEGGRSRPIAAQVQNTVESFFPYACQKLSRGVSEIFMALPNVQNITIFEVFRLIRFRCKP